MQDFLQIDIEVTNEFNIRREPEYDMSEEDIVKLIQTGSLDAFLDCLDFAPVGVIDLIKTFAVSLPMEDLHKRKALMDKTGFDVTTALRHIEEEKAEDIEKAADAAASAPQRRVRAESEEPTRRTNSKYNIVG